MKKLRMVLTLLAVSVCSLQNAWAQDEEVSVEVTLLEPNSLSTEILKKEGINDVKVVTSLKVTLDPSKGELGDQDWSTLQSMSALKVLDLHDASCKAIPDNQFSGSNSNSNCPELTTVTLPSMLETIGKYAFSSKKKLVTVVVPSTVKSIGNYAFSSCSLLENCSLASCSDLKVIPNSCFQDCKKLNSFDIPDGVSTIEWGAFRHCEMFSSPLPANLSSLGYYAFMYSAMTDVDIVLPEGMEIGGQVFSESGIKSITFPSDFYKNFDQVGYCENLTDVTFKSPTVVNINNYYGPKTISNVTLHVPSHLVAQYKTHPTWSQYKDVVAIEDPVTYYCIQDNLELNSSMRMAGTPDIFFNYDSSYKQLTFKITGETAQNFNNVTTYAVQRWSGLNNYWTMIMSDCPNVTVSGDFMQRVQSEDKKWIFMCMPFDFKVSDVTTETGQFVIRTYDGALRNTNNSATGNWKNMTGDEVITAGTGFIFQTSQDTWTTFKALKTGTNHVFKTTSDEPTIALALNNDNLEATAANTGWNFVGNPWLTYFNNHLMNYTAPFCYYDNNNNRYETVSNDDDFALWPNMAIFVQCPSGVSGIGFPGVGRQLTSEITTQQARKRTASNRQLLDIQVSDGELYDKTRLVLNSDANADYEIGLDASKFISTETMCPQIYSLDAEDTQYAINERPEGNGTLRLGLILASDGAYEISTIRNSVGDVILTDNVTGIKTNLQDNSYRFEAEAGIVENRFTLSFGAETTGIQHVVESEDHTVEVFTLDGQKAGNSTDGLRKGVYVVRKGNMAQKVIIK